MGQTSAVDISLDTITADDFNASPNFKASNGNAKRKVYGSMEEATSSSRATGPSQRRTRTNASKSSDALLAELNAL